MELGIATVASVTVICYLLGLIVKALPWDGNRYIPILCGLAGGALGVAAFCLGLPDFPASDPLTAAAVGIASGLASTGADQLFKQLSNK